MKNLGAYSNGNLPLWRELFAGGEWLALRASPTYAGCGVERGSGQPVILVPGFMARDDSMLELKCWLERIGFRAYYSGIGRNVGCPRLLVQRLAHRVDEVWRETGQRCVLIGHSLGGCLAQRAAAERPERVAHVVTLGSPVRGAAIHPIVLALGEMLRGDCRDDCFLDLQHALPEGVGETCLFTRADGVVDWRTCIGTHSTNVEVGGTHAGMIWNARVYREISRVLTAEYQVGAASGERASRMARAPMIAGLARSLPHRRAA